MRIIGVMFVFLTCTTCSESRYVAESQQSSSSTNTEILLKIAKHGLPKTTDAKHIIIIGAGIAGLTAAKLLKDAGHRVTILEASNRIGGRILTYRDPDDRFHVNLGAMRIPYNHRFVKTFVDKFNISTSDFIEHDRNTWYFVNGKKVKTWKVNENPDILGFNTSSNEKKMSLSQLFQKATEEEYLIDVAGLSNGAVAIIGITLNLESNLYSAVTESIRFLKVDPKYEIVGGMDLLPKAFLPSLENDILYNSRVTRVEHGNDTVVTYYPSSGRDVSISGDYLLTTATTTSASFIKFIPGLDLDKRNAVRNLHYDSATKIVLVFQRPFWKDEGITGGESITDLPSRSIYYLKSDFKSGVGVLLASYTFSDQSLKFLGLSDDECLTQTLNDIVEIHGEYIRELYLEGIVKKWSLDPYSLGAWTAPTPYQLKNLHIPIVRPQGNLLFAGEHTNFPHEWIEAAIRSSVEAANCISTGNCYPDLEMKSGTSSILDSTHEVTSFK